MFLVNQSYGGVLRPYPVFFVAHFFMACMSKLMSQEWELEKTTTKLSSNNSDMYLYALFCIHLTMPSNCQLQ